MRHTSDRTRIQRVLAYRRVSTREQGLEGTSLEAQKTEIQRWCKANDMPDPIDYVEIQSGGEESEEKRREVQRLLGAVRPGDAVVVSKIDRFGRDMVFIVKHVRAIRKAGACFISLAESFDSRRPESEMMLGAWAMAADMERRRIQERTQGPRKLLREQGFFAEGSVPFGYKLPKDKTRRLVVDPERAKIVREAFELAANGMSILRIAQHLQQRYPGVRAFLRYWVLKTLHNPMYTGKVSKTPTRPDGYSKVIPLPGQWVDAHEPIVSADLFAVVQRALATRTKGRRSQDNSSTAHYLMRGLARCSLCKSMMTPVKRCGRRSSGYYVCNRRIMSADANGERCAHGPYLRQVDTDAHLEKEIGACLKTLQKSLARPPVQPKRPDFAKRRADVAQKRDNVLRLVAENLVTFEGATKTLRDIENELADVDAAEAEFNASLTEDTAGNRKGALAFVHQVADEWPTLTIDVRRKLLGTLAREITVGKDKSVRIVWKDAGELAVDYAIGALPELRVQVIKALPAPRMKAADLLGKARLKAESAASPHVRICWFRCAGAQPRGVPP